MTQELVSLVAQYGLLIVGMNVLVDQIGLPVPAYPTLVVAGAIAADGQLAAGPLLLLCVLACLAADCGWYWVGEIYGIKVLKLLCRISLEPDSCVSQTQSRFERWGINSLVIAKFVPGLAIVAPPLAGAMRIGWCKFIVLSTLSAVIWVGSAIAAGMLFRAQIGNLLLHIDRIGGLAGIVVAGLLAAYIAFKWWERAASSACCDGAHQRVELYDTDSGGRPARDRRCALAYRQSARAAFDTGRAPRSPRPRSDGTSRDLPRDRDIVVYCTCPNEASAARVAKS